MVTFVTGGESEFDLLAFGEANPETLRFIEQRSASMSTGLTDIARNLFASTKQLFHDVHGSEAMRKARAALRSVAGLFQANSIIPMWELSQFQQASLANQRWIMAEPTVRKAYHRQQCDGYNGSYVDMEPGMIGRDQYDWRLVNDGMVKEAEEGEEDEFALTWYFDEIKEGDRQLHTEEKVDIRGSFALVKAIMQAGEKDPTSILNESL